MSDPIPNPNPSPEPGPAARSDRTWLYVVLAFLVFWFVYLAFFGPSMPGDAPSLENSALAGPADYSWRLQDLDGNPVSFARFQGRPVFLNLWATWCGPCVREMPSIARLAADPKLKDVAFVCVSTDDDARTVQQFLNARGRDWPMTILRAEDVPPVFATDGIPATFLIAPDGRVAASQIGSARWDDPEVVAFLDRLQRGEKVNALDVPKDVPTDSNGRE